MANVKMKEAQETAQETTEQSPSRYRVALLGVGGGGCNAVTSITGAVTSGPESFCVNTDKQALASNWGTRPVRIGHKLTQGLGAGGDPAVGRLAAEEDKDALRDVLLGSDLAILVVGLGGGTGTGAAPVLARVAREEGVLTLCFALLPFSFEGEKRMQVAREGLQTLAAQADVIVCLPNDHLLELAEEQESLVNAFARTDQMLGVCVRALHSVISHTGVMNLNFADFRQLAEDTCGLCSFGYGEGSGAKKAERAVAALQKSPYLDRGEVLARSKHCLVNISGGADLTLKEVELIMNKIRALAWPGAQLLMGAGLDESLNNKLAITVLASQPEQALLELGIVGKPGSTRKAARASGDTVAEDKPQSRLKPVAEQTEIVLEPPDKGRFGKTEPTIIHGEDLDIPTFLRRGVKLSIDK